MVLVLISLDGPMGVLLYSYSCRAMAHKTCDPRSEHPAGFFIWSADPGNHNNVLPYEACALEWCQYYATDQHPRPPSLSCVVVGDEQRIRNDANALHVQPRNDGDCGRRDNLALRSLARGG
jgi:hypothetical protein